MLDLLHDYPALLALAIFAARVCDVSLGTLRILVGFRGYRLLAAAVGFCEAAIWVVAASNVIQHLDQVHLVVAYAGGFATGNFVGITLERRLGVGRELARIISYQVETNLPRALAALGYSVVELHGARNAAPVQVMYVVAGRRQMPELLRRVHELDPEALYTITDVKGCHGEDGAIAATAAGSALALGFKRK